ncbi:restriction endonuclease subunit S [Streptomyces sp. B21-108]|uniref:restriction endonuclease subunit S n=1 Tax=Streptomyces sp. B21-108 TaxID=3039419 RepID=UPI002FF3D150
MNGLTLADLCELVVDCKNRTPPEAARGERTVGFAIGTPHIINGRIRLSEAKPVSQETFDIWTARAIPRAGDIILTREAPVGRVGRIEEGMKICLGQRTMLLRPGMQRSDSRFLHYFLLSPAIQDLLHAQASGSTVAHLRVAQVRDLKLPSVPGVDEQRRIGAVLGALDDKIAVNERIAETAENLALALASGERWDVRVRLGDLCVLRKEQISPREIPDGLVDHYSLPAFDAGKLPERENPASIKSGKFLIEEPAVLLSKLNPDIPRVWNVLPESETRSLASTEFLVLVPRGKLSTHELWAVTAQQTFLNDLASKVTGTSKSHQRVRPAEVLEAKLVDPRQFGETGAQLRGLASRAALARRESRTLGAIRDTLLPQLMSGRLRVKDAEKIVEDHT